MRGPAVRDPDAAFLVNGDRSAPHRRRRQPQRPFDDVVQLGDDGRAVPERGVDEPDQPVQPLDVPFRFGQRFRHVASGVVRQSHPDLGRRGEQHGEMVSKLVEDSVPRGNESVELSIAVDPHFMPGNRSRSFAGHHSERVHMSADTRSMPTTPSQRPGAVRSFTVKGGP